MTTPDANRMSTISRATAPILALVVAVMACSLTDPKTPGEAPGTAVAGFSGDCQSGVGCLVWSPDSKTLYAVTKLAAEGGSLMEVDPSTAIALRKRSIDPAAGGLVMSPDGATLFYSVPDNPARTTYSIYRMAMASGTVTAVASASSTDILVSPDGTALAYHAAPGTSTADTVVLLDIAAGTRRATTVLNICGLRAFSGDGTRIALNTALSDAAPIQIWNVTTGARVLVVTPAWANYLRDVRWVANDFRALYNTTGDAAAVLRDTALSGGAAVTYAGGSNGSHLLWRPEGPAVFTAVQSTFCGNTDCNLYHYDFVYSTPTGTTNFGSINRWYLNQFVASPDGHWLAHVESFGPIYLLNR